MFAETSLGYLIHELEIWGEGNCWILPPNTFLILIASSLVVLVTHSAPPSLWASVFIQSRSFTTASFSWSGFTVGVNLGWELDGIGKCTGSKGMSTDDELRRKASPSMEQYRVIGKGLKPNGRRRREKARGHENSPHCPPAATMWHCWHALLRPPLPP